MKKRRPPDTERDMELSEFTHILQRFWTAIPTALVAAFVDLEGECIDYVSCLEPFEAKVHAAQIMAIVGTTFIDHLNTFSTSLGQLLESPGWQERMPEMIQIMERMEQLEENLVDRAFTRTLVLILILLFGGVLAALLYRYVSRKVLA